jgi:hypothetical protein
MYQIVENNGDFYSTNLDVEYTDELSQEQSDVIDELVLRGKPVILVNRIEDFEFTFATKVKQLQDGE